MRNRALSVESLIDEGERALGPGGLRVAGQEGSQGPGPGEERQALSRGPRWHPGAEVIYSELMSDFETDERDFAADSWSLAVDSSFLQQQKKEVMKQQDVIYGEPPPP